MAVIWHALLETRNFRFEAFGETKAQADLALGNALMSHAAEYKLDPEWFNDTFVPWRDDEDGARPFQIGVGYRDRDIL